MLMFFTVFFFTCSVLALFKKEFSRRLLIQGINDTLEGDTAAGAMCFVVSGLIVLLNFIIFLIYLSFVVRVDPLNIPTIAMMISVVFIGVKSQFSKPTSNNPNDLKKIKWELESKSSIFYNLLKITYLIYIFIHLL